LVYTVLGITKSFSWRELGKFEVKTIKVPRYRGYSILRVLEANNGNFQKLRITLNANSYNCEGCIVALLKCQHEASKN
jgi:hypothetical protein